MFLLLKPSNEPFHSSASFNVIYISGISNLLLVSTLHTLLVARSGKLRQALRSSKRTFCSQSMQEIWLHYTKVPYSKITAALCSHTCNDRHDFQKCRTCIKLYPKHSLLSSPVDLVPDIIARVLCSLPRFNPSCLWVILSFHRRVITSICSYSIL